MIVARTLPMNPFEVMRSEMERLVDESFSRPFADEHVRSAAYPPINAWHDEQTLHLEAELPGFRPSDVEITFENDTLTIRGRRDSGTGAEPASLLRRERWSGSFERTIRLSVPVNADQIRASLTNGVLSLTLPKAPEAQPRKIAVNAA